MPHSGYAHDSPPPGGGRSRAKRAGGGDALGPLQPSSWITPPRAPQVRDLPRPGEGANFRLDSPTDLIVAYREGLGLAAVTLIAGESGAQLMCSADEAALAAGERVQARWWCKNLEQAECLVQAARRGARQSGVASRHIASQPDRAVCETAKRLGIALRSDEDVAGEAAAVIARLEQEIAVQQRAGTLKSVNRGYRDYRLAASARGEKVLRYAQWMERYKAKLMRDIAHNLRSF